MLQDRADHSSPFTPQASGADGSCRAGLWRGRVRRYLRKMRGTTRGSPPRVSWSEILWSWVGSLVGIGAVALINRGMFSGTDQLYMLGSFGASAVLLFGAPKSPLAQPRNLVGGHLLSALVGVLCFDLLGGSPIVAESFAVATAIALMHLTRTLHPPGGATALIAVAGSDELHALGYLYVLMPVGLGAVVLLVVALLVNNLNPQRRYPEVWY